AAPRTLRTRRQARGRRAPGALEAEGMGHRRPRRPQGRRRAARGRHVAVRGREDAARALGRRGPLEALPVGIRCEARRGDRRSRREDPPRRGPHEQRAPHRGRRSRRLAVDRARGLLGPEHDRFPDLRMVRNRGPRAAECFFRGLGRSLSKPYLAVALWLIQLLQAAVIILPVSNTLHALLDRSPAADKMVANPDFGWWETLRRVHPDLLGNFPDLAQRLLSPEGIRWSELAELRGIGAAAFSLALLAVVVHAFALGGVLGALREPSSSLVTFGREGMRRMPAFIIFTFAA